MAASGAIWSVETPRPMAAGRLCHAAMASRGRYRDEKGRLPLIFAGWRDDRPLQES